MKAIKCFPNPVYLIPQPAIWLIGVISRTWSNMLETIKYRPTARSRRAARSIIASVALSLIGGVVSWAQNSTPPQPLKTPGQQSSQPSPNTLPPMQLDGAAVLHHLNQVISWYRHSTTGVQSVGLSSDAIIRTMRRVSKLRSCGSHFSPRRPRPS